MERRRHARTPVNINAMLIGQKTVPKGCRVRNVSQQGMLLQCEPDGRLLTFSKGDKVEIHLTVAYASEKKSLTIPSSVRHVNEAYIYVEFQHPDLKLVELIESYRISEAHQLEASVGYENSRPADAKVTPITAAQAPIQADTPQPAESTPQMVEDKSTHRPFYYGLLTLVLAISIITGGYIYTAGVDNRLSMLETITDRQTSELVEMRERVFSSTLQEGRYASLNARMTALTDAFTSLDTKLTGLISTRLPAPPAQTTPATSGETPIRITSGKQPEGLEAVALLQPEEHPGPATSGEPEETRPTDLKAGSQTATPQLEATETETEADAEPAQLAIASTGPVSESTAAADGTGETVTETPLIREPATPPPADQKAAAKQGQWVINLLSSPDKGYVEEYAARARSRNVDVEVHSAEVKGRTYWRLQIAGFSTAAAAKAGARPVKEKLGIKDVWILRR